MRRAPGYFGRGNGRNDECGLRGLLEFLPIIPVNVNDSPARIDPEEAAIGRPTPTARRLVEASVSPNTRRAYAGALRRLDAWLDGRELHDVTLAAYLAELHDDGRVYVTNAAGQRIQGRISDVSSSILAITAGRKIWTLADGDIRRIELQDRVDTSIWLGIGIAAAGAGVLWAVERANGGIFLSALGAGAGLGWFLDASTHKTIYRKSGAARLSVSPVVSTERVGAQMSVGW